MTRMYRRARGLIGLVCLMAVALGGVCAHAQEWTTIPQIDSSTARIPITDAIYALLTEQYHLTGPAPICSKTHGAWLNLADKTADILFTVAPTPDEYQYFVDKGVEIEVKVYGYDGLVFIGNAENYVENLTGDQIRGIYSGTIKDWSQISTWEAGPIDVYIRNPESGSQRLFEELVWAGHEMPDFAALGFHEGEIESVASALEKLVYSDMEGIVYGVAANPYAIGFNIMSYVDEQFFKSTDEPRDWAVYTTGNVNLRKGPGLGFASVGSINPETMLAYQGETQTDERGVDWYKVKHEKAGECWVSSRYGELEPVDPVRISLFAVDGNAPTTENFASGKYPYVTTSIVAIRADEPQDSPARRLFDWVGSEESVALIQANSMLAVKVGPPYVYQP